MRVGPLCLWFTVAAALLPGVATVVTGQSLNRLHSRGTIAGSDAYSFPEKSAIDGYGDLYLLDSQLSNVFVVRMSGPKPEVRPICSPRIPAQTSDMTVDNRGGIWILDAFKSKLIAFNDKCAVQKTIAVQHAALSLQINSAGELVVLTSSGDTLFDLYGQNGALLRSFGSRKNYGDPIIDSELSNGHMVADRVGGFYFSFNYPPLVQHYRRDGSLIGEFKPESDVQIGAPDVSVQRQGGRLAVRSSYQILVLDMTLDDRGRLIMLLSGKPKYQAITQGSQTLLVTNGQGKVLKRAFIEDAAFHRLVAGHAALYLVKNRDGLRLDKYDLP